MTKTKTTEIHCITPDEFRNIIINDIKEELSNIAKHLNPLRKPKEEYLTRKEVAKILKISLPTISDWNKKGILNPLRIGNLIRYKKSDLEDALVQINNKH